jgi:hypothetical protein
MSVFSPDRQMQHRSFSCRYVPRGTGRSTPAGPDVSPDPVSDDKDTGADPCPELSSGNGANARQNSSLKLVFLETGHFKREKTVQFSSVLRVVKT